MPDLPLPPSLQQSWLGLVIGNTRLHWAVFRGQKIQGLWHTPHCSPDEAQQLVEHQFAPAAWRSPLAPPSTSSELLRTIEAIATAASPSLYCASVVPAQTALWQSYVGFHAVELAKLPLDNLYPTLGIDRALNLLGAGDRYGWPILVIDAGTALTFTAGYQGTFAGGAILPGLALQLEALAQKTAALPVIQLPTPMPPRWSDNTPDAIRSGVIYGMLATLQDFVEAWHSQHPTSQVILTGGDAPYLREWLAHSPARLSLTHDPHLVFWGLNCYRQHHLATGCSF